MDTRHCGCAAAAVSLDCGLQPAAASTSGGGQARSGATVRRAVRLRLLLLAILLAGWCAMPARAQWIPMQGAVQVTTGEAHSCALGSGGVVHCWGSNDYGQLGDGTTVTRPNPTRVPGLPANVVEIAAGDWHSCARTATGEVSCWGGGFGTSPVSVAGLGGAAVSISAGQAHTCAVTDGGAARCWGQNDYGQLGDGSTTNRSSAVQVTGLAAGVASIAAGSRHTCAAMATGAVKCWGRNSRGELGDGGTGDSATPIDVGGTGIVAAVYAGGNTFGGGSCALSGSGGLKCWGSVLVDTDTVSRTPADVAGMSSGVVGVSIGGVHACAVMQGGSLRCWGRNGSGELGDGGTSDRDVAIQVPGLAGVTAVAAGGSGYVGHTCALATAGRVLCWGHNLSGQLGDGTLGYRTVPATVQSASPVVALDAGGSHTCTLDSAGSVACWGWNRFGQVGDGSGTTRNAPVTVGGLGAGVRDIGVSDLHSCARMSNGSLRCWGDNSCGQVGDGGFDHRFSPVLASAVNFNVAFAAPGDGLHTCATTAAGGVKCWGFNISGQLGNGGSTTSRTPVDVAGLGSGVVALSLANHSCALTAAGSVKCWGPGPLGNGQATGSSTPVEVSGLGGAVAIVAAGGSGSTTSRHTCVAMTAGGVKCWGTNSQGQLGDGSNTEQLLPVGVMGLDMTLRDLDAGGFHTCAVTEAGAAFCWGRNHAGQLGNGNRADSNVPVAVSGLGSGVAAIRAAESHTCALMETGAVKCWGDNGRGQLGLGGRHYALPSEVLVADPDFIHASGFEPAES